MDTPLNDKQKNIIFWASFLALMAAGMGFGIRVMSIGIWQNEFNISGAEAGGLFGASLWPIAVGMILFSLIVDKIGYRISMILAFAAQIGSTLWTIFSNDLSSLTSAFVIAGFGHGIIEACINPLCATMYKSQKSKMLNILHASWPAGVALGAMLFLLFGSDEGWRNLFWTLIIPVAAYGVMFLASKQYPQDERVEANITYREMFREFGGLGVFLAATFLFYELSNQAKLFAEGGLLEGKNNLLISLMVGAAIGGLAAVYLKSFGRIMFFILCLIMIPLATAEIATDGWIRELMKPVLQKDYNIDSGWAIVLSSLIMMTLRFFAGVPLKFMSPPTLLLVSSLFSIAGLFLLAEVSGFLIFIAFVLYGIGQTFYWPTVLGFTSEQFPKGGAMTLNTVSAMGLLTVGIFGVPFLGAVGDNFDAQTTKKNQPAIYAKHKTDNEFFGYGYEKVDLAAVKKDLDFPTPPKTGEEEVKMTESQETFQNQLDKSKRKVLKVAALLPLIMGVAFLFIIGFYKLRGGYKPIILESSGE